MANLLKDMNNGLYHPLLLKLYFSVHTYKAGQVCARLLGVRGVLAYGEVGSQQTYSQQAHKLEPLHNEELHQLLTL